MQIRSWSWWVSLLVVVAACGSKQGAPSSAATARPTAQHAEHEQMCPMTPGAGARATASDTSDGVAITFTTSGDVVELRAHVRHMADMHGGMAGGHHHGGTMAMHSVPSRASVEDIPDGARLVLVPTDPAQLSALRTHAREHVAMMARGGCPMKRSHAAPPADEHAGHHPPGT